MHNKAIQKICESRRIDPDTKILLKALRIKASKYAPFSEGVEIPAILYLWSSNTHYLTLTNL